MTPKKAKDENLTPVEETTTEEVTPTPVEPEVPVEEENPVEEESKEEAPAEEEAPVETPKVGKVEIKEDEQKTINIVKAPEVIRKIIEFYGITSQDLFDKDLKKF